MNLSTENRIAEIAFHRYNIAPQVLRRATNLRRTSSSTDFGRFILDKNGSRTKIKRSSEMELLIRAYVTRRIVVAGRLMILFKHLRDQEISNNSYKNPSHWNLEIVGAAVQLTRSVGSDGYTHAAHTAPGQVIINDNYPWTIAKKYAN